MCAGYFLDTVSNTTIMLTSLFAGIAQLVERNLAKVEVASSSLVSRSTLLGKRLAPPLFLSSVCNMAGWQSGHAAACKAVYAGSIPTPASMYPQSKSFVVHLALL